MKYKLKYSPDASDKLRELKNQITSSYGKTVATRIVSKIMSEIRGLQENYAFYRLESDTVFVTDIYSEREDFMWRMFRVNLRTQDSIDFWGE